MNFLYLSILFVSLYTVFAGDASFSYDNVDDWPTEFRESCAGVRQSPIDVDSDDAVYEEFEEFVFTDYDETEGVTQTAYNTGHTIKLSFDGGNYAISGGGLTGTYNAAQLHFHWGSVSTQGSEHTIDGEEYSAELHIVHVKDGLSLSEALDDSSGVAVLGFLIEVSSEDNDDFEPLIDAIMDLDYDDGVVLNTSIVLGDILPNDISAFYRYDGSLTTPSCNEAVVWTVFHSTIPLSESQLDVFRALTDGDGNSMSNNYRPTQPINTRTIYKSENSGNILTLSLIALVLVGILHVSL